MFEISTAIIYECSKLARVFAPARHFQPSLMFGVRPGAYLRMEHLKGASLRWAPGLTHMFKPEEVVHLNLIKLPW
jgi:hypothetical protein